MAQYQVSLGDESIETTVTSDGSVVSAWINSILPVHRHAVNSLIVGVDVKRCPDGDGEDRIATLQLCVDHLCLVFQIIHCENIPVNLHQFLADNRIRFVGEEIASAAASLQNNYHLTLGQNVQDIRNIAASKLGRPQMLSCGLRYLAGQITGLRTAEPWSVRRSNWGNHILRFEQIECAAVDAFLTFTIFMELEFSY